MKFEHMIKVFSIKDLEERGIVTHPHKNIVFACRPEGACEVHDIGLEQAEKLTSLFNEMGEEGWEIIQLVFHDSGIVSFWKRGREE